MSATGHTAVLPRAEVLRRPHLLFLLLHALVVPHHELRVPNRPYVLEPLIQREHVARHIQRVVGGALDVQVELQVHNVRRSRAVGFVAARKGFEDVALD